MRKASEKAPTKTVDRREWVIYRDKESGEEICCLTLSGLSLFSKLSIPMLRRMVKQGLIAPLTDHEQLFPQETLRRVAKIERLRAHLQLGPDGLDVILELLDQLEAMEREIARLRRMFLL